MATPTPNNQLYDYKSFSVVDGTDYDVKAQQTDLFKNVPNAGFVRITVGTASITLKINSTSNPGISISTSEILQIGTHYIPIREVTNLYITNTGTSVVGILLAGAAEAMKDI